MLAWAGAPPAFCRSAFVMREQMIRELELTQE